MLVQCWECNKIRELAQPLENLGPPSPAKETNFKHPSCAKHIDSHLHKRVSCSSYTNTCVYLYSDWMISQFKTNWLFSLRVSFYGIMAIYWAPGIWPDSLLSLFNLTLQQTWKVRIRNLCYWWEKLRSWRTMETAPSQRAEKWSYIQFKSIIILKNPWFFLYKTCSFFHHVLKWNS